MSGSGLTHCCIVCGEGFRPTSADMAICPGCGGPPEAKREANSDQESGAPPAEKEVQLSAGRLGTVAAGAPVDRAELQLAEDVVAFEWKPGDVILDLYEVLPVTKGFGEDARQADYHEGGFGRVYRVFHRAWRREMAVKVPKAGKFVTQKQKDDFTAECETWANVGLHPNVAACHYVRELGGVPRIFSEYADAGTLSDWIASGRLYKGGQSKALKRILDLAIQFARGLHYAHERGVIHQDVKPLNALMWEDGTLKVTDFGLARARKEAGLEEPTGESAAGKRSVMVSVGGMTPAYCSPEQAAGENLSRYTDTWSWAVSVLEMVTGEVTWLSGAVAGAALEDFLKHGPTDENGEADLPPMPADVAALLRRCFQFDPGARPRTLEECAAALMKVYRAITGEPYPRPAPKAAGDTPDALNNRALSMLDLGKPDEAEAFFNRALELDKQHLAAIYNRGLVRWRAGQDAFENVAFDLEQIKKNFPDEAGIECALGWVRLEGGYLAEARGHFEKALEQGSGSEALRGLELARPETEAFSGGCLRTFEGHTEDIGDVTFSPDGCYAVSESRSTIKLWEISTGNCLFTFTGHTVGCFSPGDRYLLSRGKDKTLKLWDMYTGQCLCTLKGLSGYAKALSPDGRYALSGNGDEEVRLWDVHTGKCLRRFRAGEQIEQLTHTGSVHSVSFSPDGRYALSGSWDRTVKLWEVDTGYCLRTFEGHLSPVMSVVFSPDGRFALSGSGRHVENIDCTLKLWEVATGRCLRTFKGHKRCVNSVAYSPDGRYALTGSSDKTLKLWDLSSVIINLQMAPLVYSLVVTASEAAEREHSHALQLARAREAFEQRDISEAIDLLKQARKIPGFERSPDSLELQVQIGACAHIKSYISGWLKKTIKGHTEKVYAVAISPDGRYGLSGGYFGVESEGSSFRLLELSTGRWLPQFEGNRSYKCVTFSPDGRYALSAVHCAYTDVSWIDLREMPAGKHLKTFKGHKDRSNIPSVCFSPDGRRVLGSDDHTLGLWEVQSGKRLQTIEGHNGAVSSVSFSPDGHHVLSGSGDRTVKLWDSISGCCLRTFEGHTAAITSVAFSPDGCFALSGSGEYQGKENTLRLWEVFTGKCLHTFAGHTGTVQSVVFSPDGRYALSGSDDKTLKLWNLSTGSCLHTFEGHRGYVSSVAFSSDGHYALSGSGDKTVRLWELEWEYQFPGWADWYEGAKPYLNNFLTLRNGKWSEEDFKVLLTELSRRGYGWLKPEGVRCKLEELTTQRDFG
jgi:WD40 repeat protein/serine/threonine protein kinase